MARSTTIGIDLAKNSFPSHGLDDSRVDATSVGFPSATLPLASTVPSPVPNLHAA